MNYKPNKIVEIRRELDEVKPGGVFRIPPYGKTYIKTNRERNGTVTVVDLENGNMANLYTVLTVVDMTG